MSDAFDSMKAFLARLYERLRNRVRDGDLSQADFDAAVASARGHAGGKAKAALSQQAAEGGRAGLMVALYLTPDAAQALALPDGEPAEALHITLCYYGEAEDVGELRQEQAVALLAGRMANQQVLTGTVGGMGRFVASPSSDEREVIYAVPSVPGLAELRETVRCALLEIGLYPHDAHGFNPHITLKYAAPGEAMPDLPTSLDLRFEALTVCIGDERRSIPFLGGEHVQVYAEPISPPDHVRAAMRRGLRLHQEGRSGDGLKPETVRRAQSIADGGNATPEWLREARAWFARHETDRKAGWGKPGEETPGFVAWLLWGDNGNGRGRDWIERQATRLEEERRAGEVADLAAIGGGWRLFVESQAFTEAPTRIPYLPRPGTYKHPRYGEIRITRERNQRFVSNFSAGVYQDRLPVDAEHETKLSGAVAWVTRLEMNADGSADALVEWTERGKALVAAGGYRYVSPEWYDSWEDPATGAKHRDVAIGLAITTRPFFKPPALRALVASGDGLAFQEQEPQKQEESEMDLAAMLRKKRGDKSRTEMAAEAGVPEQMLTALEDGADYDMSEGDAAKLATWLGVPTDDVKATKKEKSMSEQRFAEENARLRAEVDALRKASEGEQEANKKLSERVAAMERDAQTKRFNDEIAGRTQGGAPWHGKPAEHLGILDGLARAFGEDSTEFKAYVQQQRGIAAIIQDSALFREFGSDASGSAQSAWGQIEAKAKALAKKESIDQAEAVARIAASEPTLYAAYQAEMRGGR